MKKAVRNTPIKKSGNEKRILRESLNRSIVEWHNCISGCEPVECISQFKDGGHFYTLVKKINCPTDDEVESVKAKFVNVENCLDEFYGTESHFLVNFEAGQKGDVFELAKISILLLSAVVHLGLKTDSSIFNLALLDIPVQEDIKDCISAVLLKNNSASITLANDFATVLVESPARSDAAFLMATSPKRASRQPPPPCETPQRPKRKRASNEMQFSTSPFIAQSPMKIFLDSPQMLNQVEMRNLKYKLSALQLSQKDMENIITDLDAKNETLIKGSMTKDEMIKKLTSRVSELTEQIPNDPQTPVPIPPRGSRRKCADCSFHKHTIEELQQFNDKLSNELEQKKRKLDDAQASAESFFSESNLLGKRVQESEVTVTSMQEECAQLKNQLAAMKEIADVNKTKYEETKHELQQLQHSMNAQIDMSSSEESMEIVPEKQIVELSQALQQQKQLLQEAMSVISNLKGDLESVQEEKRKALKDIAKVNASNEDLSKNIFNMTQQLEASMSMEKKKDNDIFMLRQNYRSVLDQKDEEASKNECNEQKLKKKEMRIKQLQNEKKSLEDTKESLHNEFVTLSLEHDKLKEVVESLNANVRENQASYSIADENVKKIRADLEASDEEKKILETQMEQMEKDHNEVMRQLKLTEEEFSGFKASAEQELNQKIAQFSIETEMFTSSNTELKDLNSQLNQKIEDLTVDISTRETKWSDEKREFEKECADLKVKHEDYKLKYDNAMSQNDDLVVKMENLLCETEERKEHSRNLDREMAALRIANDNLVQENTNYVFDADKSRTQMARQEQMLKELRKELDTERRSSQKIESHNKALQSKESQLERDIKILVQEKDEFSVKFKSVLNQKTTYLEQIEEDAVKINALEQALSRLQSQLLFSSKSKSSELSALNDEFEIKIRNLKAEKQQMVEENKALLCDKTKLMKDLSEANRTARQSDDFQSELSQLRSENDDLLKNLNSERAKKEQIHQQMEQICASNDEKLKLSRSEVLKLLAEKEELIHQHSLIVLEKERSHNQWIAKLTQDIDEQKLANTKLDRDVQNTNSILSEKEDNISKLQENLKDNYREISDLRLKVDKYSCSLTAMEKSREQLKAEHERLTSSLETKRLENDKLAAQLSDMNLSRERVLAEKLKHESEKENLLEKVEELERKVRLTEESKKHSEEEYAMCVDDKDRKIDQLLREKQICLSHEAVKSENEAVLDIKEEKRLKEELEIKLSEKDSVIVGFQNEIKKVLKEKEDLKSALTELRRKYEERKKEMLNTVLDRNRLELLLKNCKKKVETLKTSLQTREKELDNKLEYTSQSNSQLRLKLKDAQESMAPLKEQVEQLETFNKKLQQEKSIMSVQWSTADAELRKLKRAAEDTPSTRNRRLTMACPPMPSSRASISNFPIGKASITKLPAKASSVYAIPTAQSKKNACNGSNVTDNHSIMSGHFPMEDEEEFFENRVIQKPKNSSKLKGSPTPIHRLCELQMRNRKYLPHLRTSYPAETQSQPLSNITDSAIKNGVCSIKRPHASSDIKSEPVKKTDKNQPATPVTPTPKRSKWNLFPSPSVMSNRTPSKKSLKNNVHSQDSDISFDGYKNIYNFKVPRIDSKNWG